MSNLPRTPRQLMEMYPYQFAQPMISREFHKGWFAIFANLCADVDAMLGDERQGFRWVQLKEKLGSARWYCRIELQDKRARAENQEWNAEEERLMRGVLELIQAATGKASRACIACGKPATLNSETGWLVVLCTLHSEERRSPERLERMWLEMDESAE